MRKLHANGFDTVDWITQGLANLKLSIEPGDRILDFGCGEGALVYRFRELGYDACGFDIHKYGKLRSLEDDGFFKFFANPKTDSSDMTVSWSNYALPFENDTFALVISTQTLEHVLEPGPIMAEIARVLTPDGIALHLYPHRNWMIEPHILVPFATRIQKWWWFYMWGRLGVRNSFQAEFTARQVADANFRYCQTGVKYLTNEDMRASACPYFEDISFPRKAFYALHDRRSARHAAWRALLSDKPLQNLAPLPKLNVLLTARKRPRDDLRVLGPFHPTINGYVGRMPKALREITGEFVLFHNGKLAGPTTPGDEPGTLIVAPPDWAEQQVLTTKFDVAPGRIRRLERPFQAHSGHMFGAKATDLVHFADNMTPSQNGSPILIFENKVQLGLPHAFHVDIANLGDGRFSHWGQDLLFSSSDNSDPRYNGRTYEIVVVEKSQKQT
jgi:SAM-dependent methyltransferase